MRLFEAFCREHGIMFSPVPEALDRRPDYELKIDGHLILAEVKQLDPNKEELAAIKRQARGEQVILSSEPGGRLRGAIHSANKQFKALLKVRPVPIPTILVVYNNTPCALHTEAYAVMTAMRGLDVVDVEVPVDRGERPRFVGSGPGPKRGMQPTKNRSTSTIGVLTDVDSIHLDVYHNEHAVSKLVPSLLRFPGVKQFRLPEGSLSSFETQWREV